ncbi:MAG TPA: TGS domain-containing protein [candidate division Zixibacteria bacterium]|nr:TGS domain-containing protein [candidate division Zixibacteria bacterium]
MTVSLKKEIKIILPDGSEVVHPEGVSGYDIAHAISPGLARAAIAIKVDGTAKDLKAPINSDCSVEILTFDSPEGKQIFWHSSAHIMAQAATDIFPEAMLAIGPPIEEGFYYDFDV